MPADHEPDPVDRWLSQQVPPLPPPDGTFELITRRARRRKIRSAVASAAAAAAVAAAVAVAVPAVLSLHLTTTPANGSLAAGSSATPQHPPVTKAGAASGQAAGSGSPAAPSGRPGPSQAAAGYLPPGFLPDSVTWDSLSTGWVLGPAGTPGHCANANPDICTSVARTDDGGQTWQGLPAPDAAGPGTAAGVTGLRFLNSSYGWAFGPDLWATDDGARHWHTVNTGGAAVTDLEAASGRAYALFGDCATPAGGTRDTIAHCSSYTLMTATEGSDRWTAVGGVPAGLTAGTGSSSALIVLAAPSGTVAAAGYLVAPDGTLYAGPLDGSAWHRAGQLPCTPGPAAANGLPSQVTLAAAGQSSPAAARLALVCAQAAGGAVTYSSGDGGAAWTRQPAAGAALSGTPRSLTALPDGTLILAAAGSAAAAGGIYRLSPGAPQWQAATLSDPSDAGDGFSYVGMTSLLQGVALGGKAGLHAIWMTADGGRTWQLRPITSG